MIATKIKLVKCGCKHAFQDAIYGPGMRIVTPITKPKGAGSWRCTVCQREHS